MNYYLDSNVFYVDFVIYLQIRGYGFFFYFGVGCREILIGIEYFIEVWKIFIVSVFEQCIKVYGE